MEGLSIPGILPGALCGRTWVAIHERRSYRSRIAVVNLLYDRRRRHDTLYSRNTSYRVRTVVVHQASLIFVYTSNREIGGCV